VTHLGPAATVHDFPAQNLTPDPDYFDSTNFIDPDYGDAEITPKMGDNYLSTEIMLPPGGTMVKRHVSAHEHDRDGNPIGLANPDPILDIQLYIVNFDNGDQTELTANMIAESLYSQCDPWKSLISVLVLILTLVSTGWGCRIRLASKIPFYLL
jgi:hypothetical protein